MLGLKNEFKNLKDDNQNIKEDLIMLKIDKSLDQQIANEHDGITTDNVYLITNKLIMNKMSIKMEKNPVNKPFFLKKVLWTTFNSVLSIR